MLSNRISHVHKEATCLHKKYIYAKDESCRVCRALNMLKFYARTQIWGRGGRDAPSFQKMNDFKLHNIRKSTVAPTPCNPPHPHTFQNRFAHLVLHHMTVNKHHRYCTWDETLHKLFDLIKTSYVISYENTLNEFANIWAVNSKAILNRVIKIFLHKNICFIIIFDIAFDVKLYRL